MKIGFIGCGNMGGALATAVSKCAPVMLSDYDKEKATALANALGGESADNARVASECDYIFLGVKPQMLRGVLEALRETLKNRKDRFVLISMAAGVTTDTLASMVGDYPVIRIMPNTPVAASEGMILYCANDKVTDSDKSEFLSFMQHAGKTDEIPEKLIDAASAVSGCGPAFVYMFIEALADGGVKCGLTRKQALFYAAQTVKGAAENLMQSERHPGELKDAVCSPGGSTIAGVAALENAAFRSGVIDAVEKAYKRTTELGKQ